MEVRSAITSDYELLWELFYLMGKTDNEENTKRRFYRLLDTQEHYIPVAIINNKIVGYAWVQDYGPHLRSGKKTSRLNDLFVLPEYRNQGVASRIVESVTEWARNHDTSWLQWNSSPGAIAFYRKLGYVPLIEEEDYPSFEIEF